MAVLPIFPLTGISPFGVEFPPDTSPRYPLGTIIAASDPFYGSGEYIYLKSGVSTPVGLIFGWDANYLSFINPLTANTGKTIAISGSRGTTLNAYEWYQISGKSIIQYDAGPVGPTIGMSAATLGFFAAISPGRQVLNIYTPGSAFIMFRNIDLINGSPNASYKNSNIEGLVLGMRIAGTGIPVGSVISDIMANGTIVLSANATATGNIVATIQFPTNQSVLAMYDRPILQGQIT